MTAHEVINIIIADGTLYIIDYKHGRGVEVSAEGNPQMMLYALGALELFDGIYDIDTVRMAIYQPRRENVSVYAVAKEELLRWAEGELSEKAKLAYAGEGEFCAGEHCRFCKAKAVCRKRAEYNLELAKYDFEMPATLEDGEIAAILVKADELAAWAADVKEFALQQALSGVKYDGFKVVAGRSNRKYTDETAVADTVKKAGFDPYEPKLLGIMLLLSWIVTNLLSYVVTNLSDKSACICQKYIFNRLIALFMRIPHGCQGRQRRLYSLDSHVEYAYTLAAIDKLESKEGHFTHNPVKVPKIPPLLRV